MDAKVVPVSTSSIILDPSKALSMVETKLSGVDQANGRVCLHPHSSRYDSPTPRAHSFLEPQDYVEPATTLKPTSEWAFKLI